MGTENSKQQNRYNYQEQRQQRSQDVTQQSRMDRQGHQAAYQSPTQTLLERFSAPYSPENVEAIIRELNHPTVLERSRNPNNFNSEELRGTKQSPNLYPNLNVSHEDSFVRVNNYGQQRFSPQPSAPPASEVQYGAHGLSSQVNAPKIPPTSRPLPAQPQVNVSSAARQPVAQANVSPRVQSVCEGNAMPRVPPSPPQPSTSSYYNIPAIPGTSKSVNTPANRTGQTSNASPIAPGTSNPGCPGTNKKGGPKSSGRSRDNDISCPTCNQRYGITIFQCANGHASCKDCRLAQRVCGKCQSPITDMRNIAMEAVIADLSTTCQNQGCTLRFKYDEMLIHLNECPFGVMDCPMGTIFGQCSTRCKVADMATHFDEYHKEQRTAEIGKEMFVFNICMETHKMFLIKNGPYTFLVHIKVEESARKILMTVQLIGTKFSAERWTYEFHVYNKRQPLRKYLFVDSCQSIGTPINDIFKDNQCATLPLSYAMTFVNESTFTYKFYIKKEMNQRVRKGRTRNNVN